MSRRLLLSVYALASLVLVALLATPLVLGGRLEPRLLGLPFALWWTAGGVAVWWVATVIMHLVAGGEEPDR